MRWLAVLALALGACGGGDDDAAPMNDGRDTSAADEREDPDFGVPACTEWAERPVTASEVDLGCSDPNGINGTGVTECDDGSVLWWNDFGWGYVGEPATPHVVGAELVAPAADRDACPA